MSEHDGKPCPDTGFFDPGEAAAFARKLRLARGQVADIDNLIDKAADPKESTELALSSCLICRNLRKIKRVFGRPGIGMVRRDDV